MHERTCPHPGCAISYTPTHSKHIYCPTHRGRAAQRERETRVVACIVCGTEWRTRRPNAQFCTDSCKGQYYSETRRTFNPLPFSHPVLVLMRETQRAEDERQAAALRESRVQKRAPRECPGCGCWFCPVYLTRKTTCSYRCRERVKRWKRRAMLAEAQGLFTWSEFMAIARKFDYTCAYCGDRPSGLLEPEHVIPLSRGGSNSSTNLLPACKPCNSDKRDLPLADWARDRARRGLSPRATSWMPGDPRYQHLTHAALDAA